MFTEEELNELLTFIKRFGGIYVYPDGDENHKKVAVGCSELEKRGLVYRSEDTPAVVFFKARPVAGVNVVISDALEPGQFLFAKSQGIEFWTEYERDMPNRIPILEELGFPNGLNDEFERISLKFYKLGKSSNLRNELLEALRELLQSQADDDARKAIVDWIAGCVCLYCGSNVLPCYCRRDE